MKYGARNQIEAVVTRVKKGSVMAQVDLDVTAPHAMSSVLTAESAEEMGLQPGDKVKVIVKAIHVLIVRD